jgi:hypothetical protein
MDEISLIKSHLVGWVHKHVCFFCPVRNQSVTCISTGEDFDGGGGDDEVEQKLVIIRLAVSSVGLEKKMSAFSSYSESCPLTCMEMLHAKILQIVRDSLEKLFGLKSKLGTNFFKANMKLFFFLPSRSGIFCKPCCLCSIPY